MLSNGLHAQSQIVIWVSIQGAVHPHAPQGSYSGKIKYLKLTIK